MSTLYHPECRFCSEGQKYLSVLRLGKDMKKEGCSCCWEIETMLYITTSGDLSALQLTTPPPPSLSLSPSLPLSPSFSLWLCSWSFFPFCFTITFLITPPLCIHTVHLSMFLSVWLYLYLYMCVCVCIALPDWICYIQAPSPPSSSSILVCFGCQVVPVWYFRYVLAHVSVCAYNSLPLFVCLLYLSVSFICLLPSCCPGPKQPSWPSLSYSWNHIPRSGSHLQTPSFAQPECQIISVSVPFFSFSSCACFLGPLILNVSHLLFLYICVQIFLVHTCSLYLKSSWVVWQSLICFCIFMFFL